MFVRRSILITKTRHKVAINFNEDLKHRCKHRTPSVHKPPYLEAFSLSGPQMIMQDKDLISMLLIFASFLFQSTVAFTSQHAVTYGLSKPFLPSSTTLLSTTAFDILKDSTVINPTTGVTCKALDSVIQEKNNPLAFLENFFGPDMLYTLVVVMPQLGDFDSAEYAEMLAAVQDDLKKAKIALRVIGIGDEVSAKKFSGFHGLSLDVIRMDKTGTLHKSLNLHSGPDWDVPSFTPTPILEWFSDYVGAKGENRDIQAIARSWLNYMAMCAGIAAPDTLPEILRGYFGDKEAPERIKSDSVVTVGNKEDPFIKITGVKDVKLGPFKYEQLWKNESGYQRPVELATARLRVMVEVLTNFGEYVPDQRFLDLRGATFLFNHNDDNELLYEHIDTGVLAYSKTMRRPLSYLVPYIGEKALNPLGLGDQAAAKQ